jgi:L,D-transpeptidase YcbB
METEKKHLILLCFVILVVFGTACKSCKNKANTSKKTVEDISELNNAVGGFIQLYATGDSATLAKDKVSIFNKTLVEKWYNGNEQMPTWCSKGQLTTEGNALLQTLKEAKYYGIYPKELHSNDIEKTLSAIKDSNKTKDASLWAKVDLYLTDGAFKMLKLVKYGHLTDDSILAKMDPTEADKLFQQNLTQIKKGKGTKEIFSALEPKIKEYDSLKIGLAKFLETTDISKSFTYVPFPFKDSLGFVRALTNRLYEEGTLADLPKNRLDSASFSNLVKKYQKNNGLAADGKPGKSMMASLNATPFQKFMRVALNLDRYRQMGKVPDTYVLVFIPGYHLRVYDKDSIAVESKVIVGKPITRTPVITSAINNMVTNPYWSVPQSIISKEMLPALKRNPGYLARRNMKLLDSRGRRINPYGVNWGKYSKGIPYRVQQDYGSGNSLGVFKFNFDNEHSVYLHDTNQRYLFGNSFRALSHGCVRVQQFEKMAKFIARKSNTYIKNYETITRDSITTKGDTITLSKTFARDSSLVVSDSIPSMIKKGWHRTLLLQQPVPIYIKYISAAGRNGNLVVYDDIYGEDRDALAKYYKEFK